MPSLDLAPLQRQVWQTADAQGFHLNLDPLDLRLQTLIRLVLVHTEVSEAQELLHVGGVHMRVKADVLEELADTAIRLLEMAWCGTLSLIITPETNHLAYLPTRTFLERLGALHFLIDRVTQSVKRHGVTPGVTPLIEDAVLHCWQLAQVLGSDLAESIRVKDAKNQARPYQYGTPGGGT